MKSSRSFRYSRSCLLYPLYACLIPPFYNYLRFKRKHMGPKRLGFKAPNICDCVWSEAFEIPFVACRMCASKLRMPKRVLTRALLTIPESGTSRIDNSHIKDCILSQLSIKWTHWNIFDYRNPRAGVPSSVSQKWSMHLPSYQEFL